MLYGVAKGLYSIEAGKGTAAVLHSTSSNPEPVNQGLYGIIEVFIDTIVVCSISGFTILFTGVPLEGANANTLVSEAFATVFGSLRYIVFFALFLFAFTSLMVQWYFANVCLMNYINIKHRVTIYTVLFPVAIIIGSIVAIDIVWAIQDCALGLLIIPNMITLVAAVPLVIRKSREYFGRQQVPQ